MTITQAIGYTLFGFLCAGLTIAFVYSIYLRGYKAGFDHASEIWHVLPQNRRHDEE